MVIWGIYFLGKTSQTLSGIARNVFLVFGLENSFYNDAQWGKIQNL